MKYKVRDDYVVKLGKEIFTGGEIVELNDQQAEDYANIIELADPKAQAKAAKAEAEAAAKAEAEAAAKAAAEAEAEAAAAAAAEAEAAAKAAAEGK